jgi:hypothetical protein
LLSISLKKIFGDLVSQRGNLAGEIKSTPPPDPLIYLLRLNISVLVISCSLQSREGVITGSNQF